MRDISHLREVIAKCLSRYDERAVRLALIPAHRWRGEQVARNAEAVFRCLPGTPDAYAHEWSTVNAMLASLKLPLKTTMVSEHLVAVVRV